MLKITSVSKQAPPAAHQASAAANGRLYAHGGVCTYGSNNPESTLWWFDPNTSHWVVLSEHGPALSHHAAYVSEDRFLNFVGGWTGKSRSSEVAVFDTKQEHWLPNAQVSGFPVGAGLSSHTVTPAVNGAVVIGRLGGLRTQRVTSAVLKLTGNHETGFKYDVKELQVLSRSGHTTTVNREGSAVVLGGRYEPHRGMDSETLSFPGFRLGPSACISDLGPAVEKMAAETGKAMVASRRYHVSVADTSGKILIHGGEDYRHYSSKDVKPMKDFAVLSSKNKGLKWHNICSEDGGISNDLHLSGHSALACEGAIFMFGGFGDNWKPSTQTYKISLKD